MSSRGALFGRRAVYAAIASGIVLAASSTLGGCTRRAAPAPSAELKIAYYQGVDTSGGNAAAAVPPAETPPPSFGDKVTVHLRRIAEGGDVISFGLPLPPGAVSSVGSLRVTIDGHAVDARVTETLGERDAHGSRRGAAAALVELPAREMKAPAIDVLIELHGGTAGEAKPLLRAFDDVSADSPEEVLVAARTIVPLPGGGAALATGKVERRVLFHGREPRVLATYAEGYLASTRVLGGQVTKRGASAAAFRGLRFLSEEAIAFGGTAIFDDPYPLDPDPDSVPDPKTNYEGWLYDRCATLLLLYTHSGEERFLRHGLRSCAWYARQIQKRGPDAGIFAGKPDPDPKYSHLRGLYAYYALTGDEQALSAARAIADMWLADPLFVIPYRAGHTRGKDKLWTERLLGTSLEGLLYGHRMTGETKYLDAVRALVDTAHRHITGDARALSAINPGAPFPPQGCFIHSAAQQGEGNDDEPWCSTWMSDLLVDPLLRYQEQTGDERVDAIFIRLARFLRDVGTAYFHKDVLDDHFLAPSVCDDPSDTEDRRRLVPIYGVGLGANGARKMSPEYSDSLHCPDATALTAAALRALRRRGELDKNPVGPFASEGEALIAMHGELAFCAALALRDDTRPKRNPARWSALDLLPGVSHPAAFVKKNKIGFPERNVSPQRKLSWWFNASLEQFSLLAEAGVSFPELRPGRIAGPACRP